MTMSHPVITDVNIEGDLVHESSVVKAPVGAGRATPPGLSIKRTLQLRYADLAGFRSARQSGGRAYAKMAKADIRKENIVADTCGNHRSTGDGTGRTDWQSKLGTLCGWRVGPAAWRNNP